VVIFDPPVIAARSLVVLASLAVGAAGVALACTAPAAPGPANPVPPPPSLASAAPDAAAPLVHVRILAINDFHGNLEPPSGTNGVILVPPDDPLASSPEARVTDAGVTLVPAGGAAYLAAHVARLRAESPATTIVVSAGDLTGASPMLSNLYADEPSILAMDRLGLDFEAVGNHDFDRGLVELRRLQKAGCTLGDCDAGSFAGASFEYLAANVIDDATGRTVFPPYAIRDLGGARVAFIGETLRQTPSVTKTDAVKGLSFEDEATAANALVPELQRQGVSAIVLVIHQGGMQSIGGTYDGCKGFSGDLGPILERLSPAIDVVVSGHTHQAYDCLIDGRLVTSAMSYGRLVTRIDLTIDPSAHRVVEKHARNVPVTHDIPADPEVDRIVRTYEDRSRAITGRVVGYVKKTLTGNSRAARNASCETPLGDVIADAMRAATGADIAFMNPGGIRADLVAKREGRPDFEVTYGDAFEVQPFGNALVTMKLRGAQILALLEGQFGSRQEPRILQVSKGFSYLYAFDRAHETAAVSQLRLGGRPIDPAKTYRVTVPSFLAAGGDSFRVLQSGEDRTEGAVDVDALTTYLGKVSSAAAPLDVPAGGRITGDGCK
jgi:5'-nucleotidase